MSSARIAAKCTENPVRALISCAETPGAPSSGRTRVRCSTTFARPEASIRATSPPVPNVPLPAAHQTLMPLVSSTRIQTSRPAERAFPHQVVAHLVVRGDQHRVAGCGCADRVESRRDQVVHAADAPARLPGAEAVGGLQRPAAPPALCPRASQPALKSRHVFARRCSRDRGDLRPSTGRFVGGVPHTGDPAIGSTCCVIVALPRAGAGIASRGRDPGGTRHPATDRSLPPGAAASRTMQAPGLSETVLQPHEPPQLQK